MIVIESLGDRLSTAGINTLICIAVVFAVLIFISLIISLFRFIPKMEASAAKRKEKRAARKAIKNGENVTAAEAADKVVTQIETREEEELSDDCELVAVIAAAIAASTGTSADGFVVRSIRKVRR